MHKIVRAMQRCNRVVPVIDIFVTRIVFLSFTIGVLPMSITLRCLTLYRINRNYRNMKYCFFFMFSFHVPEWIKLIQLWQ